MNTINRTLPKTPNDQIAQLEAGLAIDQNALDEACLTQPDRFYKVAKAVATYQSKRDAAKQELQEIEATTSAFVRHQAEVAGDKVTEKAVENQVILSPEVQNAKKRLNMFNEKLGILIALKEAYIQRSYVIKDLATLWVASYYGDSSVRVSEDRVKTARADRAREAQHRLREAYNG